eukprot:268404_1
MMTQEQALAQQNATAEADNATERKAPLVGSVENIPGALTQGTVSASDMIQGIQSAGMIQGAPAAGMIQGVPSAGMVQGVPSAGMMQQMSVGGGVDPTGIPGVQPQFMTAYDYHWPLKEAAHEVVDYLMEQPECKTEEGAFVFTKHVDYCFVDPKTQQRVLKPANPYIERQMNLTRIKENVLKGTSSAYPRGKSPPYTTETFERDLLLVFSNAKKMPYNDMNRQERVYSMTDVLNQKMIEKWVEVKARVCREKGMPEPGSFPPPYLEEPVDQSFSQTIYPNAAAMQQQPMYQQQAMQQQQPMYGMQQQFMGYQPQMMPQQGQMVSQQGQMVSQQVQMMPQQAQMMPQQGQMASQQMQGGMDAGQFNVVVPPPPPPESMLQQMMVDYPQAGNGIMQQMPMGQTLPVPSETSELVGDKRLRVEGESGEAAQENKSSAVANNAGGVTQVGEMGEQVLKKRRMEEAKTSPETVPTVAE